MINQYKQWRLPVIPGDYCPINSEERDAKLSVTSVPEQPSSPE